ncbi:SANT/Myb domain [Trinorchestia longiramus]|nr:SANT/Myb domain [Trinorchestia longiramus]
MESVEDSSLIINIKKGISPLIQIEVEPVGVWYHLFEHNRRHGHSHEDNVTESDNSDDSKERENKEVVIKDDITFLRSLDPCKWKDQDHYKVLGLQDLRYKASDDDIKKAHRLMVLRHHPDKRRGAGEEVRDGDDYFTNITKAYEILGDPIKRRSYDSVDPQFDDKVPSDKPANKDKFFEVFGPVFQSNSQWSQRKHVPQLGSMDDSQEKVNNFYDFWYNFDSWREFSYLDEEDKEKGEDRDERRWIEKQNKAERAVRRKEESARIRKLVDNAYKLDPRVIKFREAEREKKMAVKRAKQEAARQREENELQERVRKEEEERTRKEREESELKERLAKEKKEREQMKKQLRVERKTMRDMCKGADYFIVEEKDRVQAMMDVETLCDGLQLLQLKDLISRVTETKDNKEETRKIIKQEVNDLRSGKLTNINIANMNQSNYGHTNGTHKGKNSTTTSSASSSNSNSRSSSAPGADKEWSVDELQLLIKAVNLFPAGTAKRWDVVAKYLCQHGPNKDPRSSKEVLQKAKELQNSDASALKEAANKGSLGNSISNEKKIEKLEKREGSSVSAQASERLETPQEMLGMNLAPWSAEEQTRLEQALKSFPANTPSRWDRIAEAIPGRNKKDCMRRFKELAEMVKAKKAAMQAAGVKK